MRVRDVMTSEVVAVRPATPVKEVAGLLAKHRISAVPVVDAEQRVIGIVSEGDLMHRAETGTAGRRSWWLEMVASDRVRAADFVKANGRTAGDVMTRDVISVGEDAALSDIAILLETHGVKRLPVVRGGRLVGIVSRADLVRALALTGDEPGDPVADDDRAIRDMLADKLKLHKWAEARPATFTVKDRVVHLWGSSASEEERRALRVAAETVKGVERVVEHTAALAPDRR